MNEMLQRVVNALTQSLVHENIYPDQYNAEAVARDIVGAMREPTEAMLDAAGKTGRYGGIADCGGIEPDDFDPEKVWHAMIEASLK